MQKVKKITNIIRLTEDILNVDGELIQKSAGVWKPVNKTRMTLTSEQIFSIFDFLDQEQMAINNVSQRAVDGLLTELGIEKEK